jgi:predicted dehydrogenase
MKNIKHRVGIIGLEHWYWTYPMAGGIITKDDVSLDWICSSNEKQAKETAELFGVQNWTSSYDKVLSDSSVDIVIVTPTTDMHDEIAIAAAKAGKHILMGKPISRTLAGADRIVRAVKESGIKVVGIGAGPNPMDPVFQLVKKNVIGTPYAAASSCRARMPLGMPGDRNVGWFADIDRVAGGAFVDHAIYAATKFEMLFDSRVKSIYAQLSKMIQKDWDLEDYGIALLRYENGAIATIESTFGVTEYTLSSLLVTGTEGEIQENDDEIRIVGKKPDYRSPVIYKKQPSNPVYFKVADYKNPFCTQGDFAVALFDELIKVIDEGYTSLNTVENARNGLEICLAAYKSAELGRAVELPLRDDVDVKDILKRIL